MLTRFARGKCALSIKYISHNLSEVRPDLDGPPRHISSCKVSVFDLERLFLLLRGSSVVTAGTAHTGSSRPKRDLNHTRKKSKNVSCYYSIYDVMPAFRKESRERVVANCKAVCRTRTVEFISELPSDWMTKHTNYVLDDQICWRALIHLALVTTAARLYCRP